ncbi:hypothetical protein A2U01_0097732, partial [Trifolium medium]|nr:hypothetical protein [Trifolium medium]
MGLPRSLQDQRVVVVLFNEILTSNMSGTIVVRSHTVVADSVN